MLVDHPGLDPELVWDAVAREHVQTLTIVGDVFARPLLDALRARTRPVGPLVAARDHVVGRALQPRREARPARSPRRRDHRRLARRVGGPRARASRRAPATPRSRRPQFSVNDRIRVVDEDDRTRRGARLRRDRPAGDGRAHPARLLQGPGEERGHVPHARRRPLLDPRRLRHGRDRRHRAPARTRVGVHQHRRREGLPRGGRGRAAQPPGRRSTAWWSASPTSASASAWWRWCRSPTATPSTRPRWSAWCRARMAGYKAPRRFLFVDSLQRSAAGKAHHRRAARAGGRAARRRAARA